MVNQRASSAAASAVDYVSCPSAEPLVVMRRDAACGIHAEAIAGLNALPRRGAEVGGILIGSLTPDGATIESFVPVESEHRYGPSYLLSESDCERLAKAVSDDYRGLEVVGYYRSDTRPDFEPDSHDAELIGRLFPNRSALFLLVRPARSGASRAALYMRGDNGLEALGDASCFPFTETAPIPFPSESANTEPVAESEARTEPEPHWEPEATADTQITEIERTGGECVTPNEAPPEFADWFASAEAVGDETAEPLPAERILPIWVWVLLVAGIAGLGALLGYLSVTPP
ncbi:MAG TPA: hypothetical protein VN428_02980 [Bryobacteraceae bacterium]|nr:hypothetical protein [Bryobacteraceae bacterium]